jgi:replication factor A2
VTIVAQVISIQSQTTNSVYWLDDGSGRIEARHWVDSTSDVDSGKWGGISENAYVRATGALKTFGNKRYINVAHIRLVKDSHELYFHLLEAMATNLIFERGPPVGPGQPQQQLGGQAGHSAYTAQPNTNATKDNFAGFPPIQRAIINFITSQPPNDEGVHVAAIARAIGGDAHHISGALDLLMEGGIVFTTIDDSHFKMP